MLKLIKYLKGFKKEVIIGPAFKLTEAIFELIVPLVMAKIIDVGIANRDKEYIFKMGGIMLLLGASGLCLALICQYLASKASQGVGTVMRNDIFKHINTLSHADLDKLGSSSLVTRITNDVNQLQLAVAMLIRLVVRAPFLVIGATVMSFMLDLKLSLIFLLIIPLVSFILYKVMSSSIPFYRIIQKKLDKLSLLTRENLEGARVIRAFSGEKHEEQRFKNANDDITNTSISVGKISALLSPLTYLIMNFAILLILWFGGMRVDDGALTQGQIIAFVNYMTQILLALVVLANLVVIFTKASASASRVNEIFATKASICSSVESDAVIVEPISGAPKIEFRDVSFSYVGGEYALSDISLEIISGETVGIIGGTGCGKSTLINLIPRFYDVSKGEILIDGVNVKNYSTNQLRKLFGIVQQKAVLFSGTIRENLVWGCEYATAEQLDRALKISQSYEFVSKLSEGYDAKVSQGATNFSGGQKQRLSIARALVSNPQILILDDSSSALDTATDLALRTSISENFRDSTVIIVSQRASSIKYADKILVLDDGVLVGIGTHTNLLQDCAIYKEICISQEVEGE